MKKTLLTCADCLVEFLAELGADYIIDRDYCTFADE